MLETIRITSITFKANKPTGCFLFGGGQDVSYGVNVWVLGMLMTSLD